MGSLRVLPALLAAALCLCLTAPARAADAEAAPESGARLVAKRREAPVFSDVPAGGVFAPAIAVTCETGLLEGYPTGVFAPGDTLTHPQIAAVAARLHSLLTGGDGSIPLIYDDAPWYQGYYQYLDGRVAAWGGSGAYPPEKPCTRLGFARLLNRVLSAAGASLPAVNHGAAPPDCDDPAVLALYRAGVLEGTDEAGSFQPDSHLTRGQAAAVLARLIDPAQRLSLPSAVA